MRGTIGPAFFRSYQRSHPWITFRADLSRAPVDLWLLLGEARSKFEHVAGVPLKPALADALNRVFLARGAHATTAIEGNTLTEKEVEDHLRGELKLPPSREYLKTEVDNVVRCFNAILEGIREHGPSDQISAAWVMEVNREILADLEVDEGVESGKVRQHAVGVANYRGAPPEDCEFLLGRLCDWLNHETFDVEQKLGTAAAVLKAILAHLYIAWIHPFGDGNGRTARLLEFFILVNAGVPVPAAHLLSDYYNKTRPEYYRQLDRASKSGGNVVPFILYGVQGLVEQLKEQLDLIREQQWQIAWADFVNVQFEGAHSQTHSRRKQLVLDLSAHSTAVARNRLTLLSPRVATAYARKTDRTLSRDLNALVEAELLEQTASGYRARREQILAFLPPSNLQRRGSAASED